MKTRSKNMIIITILIYIIFSYINPLILNKVYASSKSKKEIGEYIAQFAENFANSSVADETIYSWNAEQRAAAYRGEKCSGRQETYKNTPQTFSNKYAMDCVGWVSFVIHQATGLDLDYARNGSSGFVIPSGYYVDGYYFEKLETDNWQRGDILIKPQINDSNGNISKYGHVMVYIGNNQVVDCLDESPAVAIRNVSKSDIKYVARITDDGVKSIKDSALTTVFNGYGSLSDVDLDKYYGTVDGRYVGTTTLFKFASLDSILDWLIGIMTMGIKIQLIGWFNIVENLVTSVVNGVTGNDNVVPGDNQQTTILPTNKLTVESIVYNRVQLLDVNIFDLENAAGAPLDKNGIIYILRENIATWYWVFRQIGIIGLLITLIYIGIRMAISTVAEEKAKYKKMLANWVVSFIIVYFIHYFMIAVISINNTFVSLFSTTINEASLYDTIRTKSYEIKFSTGFGSTMMYVVLVYVLVRYLFIYIKRWFLVSILTLVAPLLGIAYSIQKIKDNKSKALTNWMNDYIQAVFTQTFHALVYTIFMQIAIKLAMTSLSGMVIALVFINFIPNADKMVRDMFKLGGKSAGHMMEEKSLKDLATQSVAAGIAIKAAKVPFKAGKKAAIWTANLATGRNEFVKDVKKELGTYDEIKDRQKEAWIKGVKANWEMIKDDARYVTNAVVGAGALMAAVPATIVNPDKGIALAYLAKNRLDKLGGKKQKIYGCKKKVNKNIDIDSMILKQYSSEGFGKNAFGEYFNPWTDEYDANYDPTKDNAYIKQAQSKIKVIEEKQNKENSKKYTRRIRKVTAFMAGGYALDKAWDAANERSQRNIKEKQKIGKERESLEKAKGILEEIREEIKERNKNNSMSSALENIRLRHNIADEFKTVSSSEIDRAINDYMRKNNIEQLSRNDMDQIIKELSNKLGENSDLKDEKDVVKLDTQKLKANIDAVVKELDTDELTKIDPNSITVEQMTSVLKEAIEKTGSIEKMDIDDANKHIIQKLKQLKQIDKKLKDNGAEGIDSRKIIEDIINRGENNES